MLNITKQPQLIEAAFNKFVFEVNNPDYQLGEMFFCEILDQNNIVVTTLTKTGSGAGYCEFDLSTVVQSLFPEPKILASNVILQPDETALIGYRVKLGVVKLSNRVQEKVYYYSSDILYALRAALPLDGSKQVSELVVDYTKEAKFLTDITPNQSQSADLFLPVLVTAPTTVKFVCDYGSLMKQTTHELPQLGVYVFNANPILQSTSASSLSVWLESDTPTYRATMSATVQCSETGMVGSHTATATATSTVSLDDATSKAMIQATSTANANLVCVPENTYTATATYTAVCAEGYTGSYTSTQSAFSTISQVDADQKARTAAQADAEANLVCAGAETFTATETVTVTCGDGTTRTATATATSTDSQLSAQQQAYYDAQEIAYGQCPADTYFTETATATVTCGDGSSQTATATATGTSQNQASVNAYYAAQEIANSQCSQGGTEAARDQGYSDGAVDGAHGQESYMLRFDDTQFTTQAERDAYRQGYDQGFDDNLL